MLRILLLFITVMVLIPIFRAIIATFRAASSIKKKDDPENVRELTDVVERDIEPEE